MLHRRAERVQAWWNRKCKPSGYMSVSALGGSPLPSTVDPFPAAIATKSEAPDFADLLSVTTSLASGVGVFAVSTDNASAEGSVAESSVPDSEVCEEAPSFDGLGYLFMLQPAPNQSVLDSATDMRYSLRPELVEVQEGDLGGNGATAADALPRGPDRTPHDLQWATGQPVPNAELLDVQTDVRTDFHQAVPAADVENLIRSETNNGPTANTNHTPIPPDLKPVDALMRAQPHQAGPEDPTPPQPPDATSIAEPSAEPSAGLQAFHVRVSKPMEELATKPRSRDSLLQKTSAESTPVHAQSIAPSGAGDESGTFTDAVSAARWVEPDVQQTTPLRQVSVAFESADGPIYLRVHDRAGEMRAWVSTSTERIVETLQKGLVDLTHSLNAAGFEAEVSLPRTVGAALAQDVQSDTAQSDGNSRETAHHGSQDRGADERGSGRERRSGEGEDFSSFLR